MPRQYTQRWADPGMVSAAEDFADQSTTQSAEFNGLLDQNQIPLDTISKDMWVPPLVDATYNYSFSPDYRGGINSTYLPSQSYHTSAAYEQLDEQNPSPDNTIETEYDPEELTLGWIKLQQKRTCSSPSGGGKGEYPVGSALGFRAQEGMVVGEAQVDIEWRKPYLSLKIVGEQQSDSEYYFIGLQFVEIGVFVNDVCCGQTDWQWVGGRYTFVVPYSTPIGSQDVNIDIRFRVKANTWPYNILDIEDTPNVSDVQKIIQNLYIHDTFLWARNQYR